MIQSSFTKYLILFLKKYIKKDYLELLKIEKE